MWSQCDIVKFADILCFCPIYNSHIKFRRHFPVCITETITVFLCCTLFILWWESAHLFSWGGSLFLLLNVHLKLVCVHVRARARVYARVRARALSWEPNLLFHQRWPACCSKAPQLSCSLCGLLWAAQTSAIYQPAALSQQLVLCGFCTHECNFTLV